MRTKHAPEITFLYCPYEDCSYKTPRGDVLYRHINSDKHKSDGSSKDMDMIETDSAIEIPTPPITQQQDIASPNIIADPSLQITGITHLSKNIPDAQSLMSGNLPPGSEYNYPKVIYSTIDTNKFNMLMQQADTRVNQAKEITPAPKISQECVSQLQATPSLTIGNTTGIVTISTVANNPNFITTPPMMSTSNIGEACVIMNGQEIMDTATSAIQQPVLSYLPLACSSTNRQSTYKGEKITLPTLIQTEQPPQPQIEDKEEIISPPGTFNSEEDSVIEDLVLNYTTEIITSEETENSNGIPTQNITASQIQNNQPQEPNNSDNIIKVKPIVRVAMLDFDFKPTVGEVYQVNGDGHLMRVELNPGTIFQVNYDGNLEKISLPIPASM
jgi:hypothetical protein